MHNKQLFNLAPVGFETYRFFNADDTVVVRKTGRVPLPVWPDGRWCFEVAAYIKSLAEKNFSVYGRGGTLATYTSELSYLIRFCYLNGTDFINLTDNEFKLYVNGFLFDWDLKNGVRERKLNDRSVVLVGRHTLNFLEFVGKLHGIVDFVAPDGRIQATRKVSIEKDENGRIIGPPRFYWTHPAFPTPSPLQHGHPISPEDIGKLRQAVVALKSSAFVRERRLVLLRLLEKTGARRIEIASITVDAIYAAQAMNIPFLEIDTYKQRGPPAKRLVPMHHVDLDFIIQHIEISRAVVIDDNANKDDGFLLINVRTCKGITPNTITLELHKLCKKAGLTSEKAHPQMFRHRFITNLMIQFMREHHIANKDQFVKMLLDMSAFKKKAMEYTGHKKMASIDSYIDWARFEMANFDETVERAKIADLSNSASSSLEELELIRDFLSPEEFAEKTLSRLRSLTQDLARGR